MNVQQPLPFPALVGLEAAQQALLLLAIEPQLRGVVLAAAAGSGKSTLARGLSALLGANVPPVDLPLHANEESLLGGLDVEATLRGGSRVARRGLLARADGGLLVVDGLNLLSDTSANLLLSVVERGEVCLERDGLSTRIPARFRLIACYDPAEGVPRGHLLDRVGLLAVLPPAADAGQRADVVRRNLLGQAAWDEDEALLQALVAAAREHLPSVQINAAQIEQLADAAVQYGVQGQRVDLFAVHAARAAAALALRDEVEDDDLRLALRLVIVPRATRMPEEHHEDAERGGHGEQKEQQREAVSDQENMGSTTNNEAEHDPTPNPQPPTPAPEAQVFAALAAHLPPDLLDLPFRALRRGRSGGRGSTASTRGRHIRSTPGDVRRARIDVAATLRAAAPWQTIRGQAPRGYLGNREQRTQAHSAFSIQRSAFSIQRSDLRVKQFRSKAGTLFCVAVDASGSMALHRMRQAKGAVHALLQQAYVHRDRVALVAFRGATADVLLPPSQSVELARRAVDLLPTGGGTPLAAALLRASDVAQQARRSGIWQTVLVLLTDGRANVSLRGGHGEVEGELQHIAREIVAAGIKTIVIDTQRQYLSRGEARRLAGWLDGTYVQLPHANSSTIAALAQEVADG